VVEPIAVVDRPGRKLDIRLVLDDVVLTETRHGEGEPGADLHVHRQHVDCFYVLDGALRISRTDGDHVFTAGQFVLVPPNVVHGFRNHGSEELRFLNLHTPAMGFDRYLRGILPAEEFDQHPPPKDGGADPASVIVRTAETDALEVGGARVGLLANAEDALSAISLVEYAAPPGFPGPPLHLHERTWDAYYVLEGRLDVRLSNERLELRPGDVAVVPPDTVHGFSNPLDRSTRFLDIHAPGGFEGYFRELAAGGTRDRAEIAQIGSRYDMILA
jgi:mannose-6-phosphate isomerase-like protein (cupin superfamily)